MRARISLTAAIAAAAALLLTSGCAGTANPPAPAVGPLTPSAARIYSEASQGNTLVYVTDTANGAVDAFTPAGKMVAQATGLFEPQGVGTATNGDVYVADTEASSVIVYSAGLKANTMSLGDSGEYPVSVAISGEGEVAVANIINTSGGAGGISFYKKGADQPSRVVTSATVQSAYFCGYDAKGTLWFDGLDTSGATIVATIAKGSSKIKVVPITGGTIGFPGGVAVDDANGFIVIGDQLAGVLDEITDGGAIKGSVTLTGGSPAAFALWYSDTKVFSETSTGTGEWKFPAGGSPLKEWSSPAGEIAVGKT